MKKLDIFVFVRTVGFNKEKSLLNLANLPIRALSQINRIHSAPIRLLQNFLKVRRLVEGGVN